MHEIGMLYRTAETATRFAEEKGIDAILSIHIDLGELSGALPQVFTSYFPFVAEQYPCLKDAKLHLRTIPGEALCSRCQSLYNVMRQKGVCPGCQSREKTILGGQDIKLVSIQY